MTFSVMRGGESSLYFIFNKRKKEKRKLPLGTWGQIFNLAVTLNRNIKFKMM